MNSHGGKKCWLRERKCSKLTLKAWGRSIGKKESEERFGLRDMLEQKQRNYELPKPRDYLSVLHGAFFHAWLSLDHSWYTICWVNQMNNALVHAWRSEIKTHAMSKEQRTIQCSWNCPPPPRTCILTPESGLHLSDQVLAVSVPISHQATDHCNAWGDLFGAGKAYFYLHLLSTSLLHILLWDVKSSACTACAVGEVKTSTRQAVSHVA